MTPLELRRALLVLAVSLEAVAVWCVARYWRSRRRDREPVVWSILALGYAIAGAFAAYVAIP